jgi:DNA polymerase-3 subunit alpha
MEYVNLHGHSTFSHGDGHKLPRFHVERAAALGYTAMALTEHGGNSSHFQLEKYALIAGIKPIFGLEAYTGAVDEEHRGQYKFHLTILARNQTGYRNLNKVITQSWKDYHYHPTVSGVSLAANREGLVALSGCTGSLLACSLVGGKNIPEPTSRDGYGWDDARLVIHRFQRLFGDDFYLEVQPFWELDKSGRINRAYEKLSKETGVPLVVTCDVHYPRPEDGEMQAILHAVHRGKHSIDDVLREWNYEVPMTLPESDRELAGRLMKTGLSRTAAWEAIETSARIAEGCNVTLPKADRLQYPISKEDDRPWTSTGKRPSAIPSRVS